VRIAAMKMPPSLAHILGGPPGLHLAGLASPYGVAGAWLLHPSLLPACALSPSSQLIQGLSGPGG
jgi:hypothetical protein